MTASEKRFVKFMSGKYSLIIFIMVPAIMGSTAMFFVKSSIDRAPLWIAIGLTFIVIVIRAIASHYANRLIATENKLRRISGYDSADQQ